jgi:hypothetical protein
MATVQNFSLNTTDRPCVVIASIDIFNDCVFTCIGNFSDSEKHFNILRRILILWQYMVNLYGRIVVLWYKVSGDQNQPYF